MCKTKIILILAVISLGLVTSCSSRNIYADYPVESGNRQIASIDEESAPRIVASAAPTSNTCYLSMAGDIPEGAKTQWAYGAHAAWTGPNADVEDFSPANCDAGYLPYACTSTNLSTGESYYFAVRLVEGSEAGKWSNVVVCKTP